MSRNIVLCLDGTGNQLRAKGSTNVVLLYQMLDLSDPERQVAFYDPGVGTFSAKGAWTRISQKLTKALGLLVGYGIKDNLVPWQIRFALPGGSPASAGAGRYGGVSEGVTGAEHVEGEPRQG
jgi:uncharacterized protein (DUF2235 family)